jgi:hypothetical protein
MSIGNTGDISTFFCVCIEFLSRHAEKDKIEADNRFNVDRDY